MNALRPFGGETLMLHMLVLLLLDFCGCFFILFRLSETFQIGWNKEKWRVIDT